MSFVRSSIGPIFSPSIATGTPCSKWYELDKGDYDDEEEIVIDSLSINFGRHEVYVDKEKVDLTFKEFELLGFLAKNRGHAFTRDELLDKVWGIDYVGETRTVDVHIRYLRKKLRDKNEKFIETIRGKGYKLK